MGSCASKQPDSATTAGRQVDSNNRPGASAAATSKANQVGGGSKLNTARANQPGGANSTISGSGSTAPVPPKPVMNSSSESSNDDSTRYNDKYNEKHNSFYANSPTTTNNTMAALNSANTNTVNGLAANGGGPNPTSSAGSKEVKVLLLGSGESGKSTIVKQMKILHQNGYTKEELLEYKPYVYRNALECIKMIINAIIDLDPSMIKKNPSVGDSPEGTTTNMNGHLEKEENQAVSSTNDAYEGNSHFLPYDDLNQILDYEININSEESFDEDIAKKIDKIYRHPKVQEFIKYHQGDFYLIDSTHYFLSDIFRICKKDFIPNTNDILRTRKKTSGIYDFKFQMGSGLMIHMFDVGGQRSERKKWIHCFDNVTLIIFCVALSEYDQVLLEENSQNRLEESLTLFDSVVNSRWFARTSIVLFLNKIDVFADKLPYSPLEKFFPDYTGGNNINKAAKYILWRFSQVNRSGLNIFPHVTQATDTSNIELVFAAVKETILENSLKDSGLL